MKVEIYCPSYRRPQKSSTQLRYPGVKLVVAKSEAREYRKNGNIVVGCPDEIQGNTSRIRNWILDKYLKKTDCLILMDDDNLGMFRWEDQVREEYDDNGFMEMCENSSILCRDYNLYMWGVNCVTDKGAYREHTPFSLTTFIGGPFQAFMKGNKLRYDEGLPLKEDYDMTLQNHRAYGGALRLNYVFYVNKQSEQPGGCALIRNLDREKEQFLKLQEKWGNNVIKRDMKSKREFDYNPVMRSPIKGI